MHTTKFRGKILNGTRKGEWVYGYYYATPLHFLDKPDVITHCIIDTEGSIYKVDPNTVGQYIGRKDLKGTEIYTDDLFQYDGDWDGVYYAIMQFSEDFHDDPSFHAVDLYDRSEYIDIDGLEVFGSIHDNPTLLTQ